MLWFQKRFKIIKHEHVTTGFPFIFKKSIVFTKQLKFHLFLAKFSAQLHPLIKFLNPLLILTLNTHESIAELLWISNILIGPRNVSCLSFYINLFTNFVFLLFVWNVLVKSLLGNLVLKFYSFSRYFVVSVDFVRLLGRLLED